MTDYDSELSIYCYSRHWFDHPFSLNVALQQWHGFAVSTIAPLRVPNEDKTASSNEKNKQKRKIDRNTQQNIGEVRKLVVKFDVCTNGHARKFETARLSR